MHKELKYEIVETRGKRTVESGEELSFLSLFGWKVLSV
jgi:hypothetical protein